MLEHKGIEYRRVDLVLLVYKPVLKLLGFRRATVPILRLGGRSIQGTRTIARELEMVVPEPPLFPADPRDRALVEQAEQWGEEVLQEVARRVGWWTVRRDRSGIRSYLAGTHVGIPHAIVAGCTLPFAIISCSLFGATDDAVRADLANLPRALDRIDNWLADGVLGREQLTAADFQIAPALMLLMSFDDIRPLIEYRPAGRFARRVASQYPGRTATVQALRSLLAEVICDARVGDSAPVAR
jgi:glutathione S-transferase